MKTCHLGISSAIGVATNELEFLFLPGNTSEKTEAILSSKVEFKAWHTVHAYDTRERVTAPGLEIGKPRNKGSNTLQCCPMKSLLEPGTELT